MNDYELTCLISSALEEKERNNLVEEIKTLITTPEGEVINLSPLSEVDLGYPIKDEIKAYMLIIDFKISNEKIEELKNGLKDKKELLRFFLIRKGKKPIRTVPKRQIENISKIETGEDQKIKLKDIDKKIEEILSPSREVSEEETKEPEGNEQNNELK